MKSGRTTLFVAFMLAVFMHSSNSQTAADSTAQSRWSLGFLVGAERCDCWDSDETDLRGGPILGMHLSYSLPLVRDSEGWSVVTVRPRAEFGVFFYTVGAEVLYYPRSESDDKPGLYISAGDRYSGFFTDLVVNNCVKHQTLSTSPSLGAHYFSLGVGYETTTIIHEVSGSIMLRENVSRRKTVNIPPFTVMYCVAWKL